ncbi:hypothetical protein HYT23_00790 [Candidatus Pacearchaeota archaeon]|nr:hypothetical protein [Candidatus Pacearchaeota archaeon]
MQKKMVRRVQQGAQTKSKFPIHPNVEKYFLIPVLVFLIIIVAGAIVISLFSYVDKAKVVNKIPTCGDGSFYNTCSLTEPYYCTEGILAERASICGCSSDYLKQGDICLSRFHIAQKEVTLKYILNGQAKYISFPVYGEMARLLSNKSREISYAGEEKPFRVDFKLQKINEPSQRELLLPLVVKIQNLAKNKEDQARIAVSLVQNILFGASDKEIQITDDFSVRYSRYPYEILHDRMGVCGEKSELLAFLLKELNYGVVLFYYHDENHEAVGISCPVINSVNKSGYCFAETSGPSIISDDEIEYAGGIKLRNSPEIMLISDGVSLSESFKEYEDADVFKEIRRKMEKGDWLTDKEKNMLQELRKKYGLVDVYNV